MIRPDGTESTSLVPFTGPSACITALAWSPDSQRIAMLVNPPNPAGMGVASLADRVWIIDRDGADGVRTILSSDTPTWYSSSAWSPDGASVAVTSDTGAYLIDANCDTKPTGCGESARTAIAAIPQHWLSTFYPQWLGENVTMQSPTPAITAAFTPGATDTPTTTASGGPPGTISGTVIVGRQCADGQAHTTFVHAFRSTNQTPRPDYEVRLPAPGPYVLSGVAPGKYSLNAILDCDESGTQLISFTSGDVTVRVRGFVTVTADSEVSGIDLTLELITP